MGESSSLSQPATHKHRNGALYTNACALRKRGFSYNEIQARLGISKSTLSNWLADVQLTKEQKERLKKNEADNRCAIGCRLTPEVRRDMWVRLPPEEKQRRLGRLKSAYEAYSARCKACVDPPTRTPPTLDATTYRMCLAKTSKLGYHPDWRFVRRHGNYMSVVCRDHPYCHKSTEGVYVHRIVAECMLGRLLTPSETGHHINGERRDNRHINIEVMTRSVHSKHHRRPQRFVALACAQCGKPFLRRKGHEPKEGRLAFDTLRCVGLFYGPKRHVNQFNGT